MKALALMYHDVTARGREDASGFPGGDARRYKLTLPQFEEHLRAIQAAALRPPAIVRSRESVVNVSPDSLALTFDDGGVSGMGIADRLEQAGWRGHFFITTGCIGLAAFLSREHIRDLHSRGHVIGSHSYSHPLRMAHCTLNRLREEWHQSVASLSDVLGTPITMASVPGGDQSRLVSAIAEEAGVEVLFTSEPICRVRRAGGLLVMGRYTVTRGTMPATIAAMASGARLPRLRQLAAWKAKNVAKMIGGPAYLAIRARVLNAGT